MAWCFEDESTSSTDEVLDRLRNEDALVPSLWALEVANVLLIAERRGRITEATATHFMNLLDQLSITVDLAPPSSARLLTTGRRHELTAYDAAYLDLAEREGVPLATLDKALVRAAGKSGVPLLI